MNKFKVGTKVIVTEPDKFFNKNDVGVIVKVHFSSTLELKVIEGRHVGMLLMIDSSQVVKFIEPKYKIGDRVLAFPSIDDANDIAQIVQVAVNKKLGECCYLAFTLESGLVLAFEEHRIKLVKKVSVDCACDVEEMTLAQVCKKLGKNIKIIK